MSVKPGLEDILVCLGQSPLAGLFCADELSLLAGYCELARYEQAATVFREDDPEDALGLVVSGELEFSQKSLRPGQRAVSAAKAGVTFGELSLLENGKREAQASAKVPSEILWLKAEDFARLEIAEPGLAFKLLGYAAASMSRRLREASGSIIYGFSSADNARGDKIQAEPRSWKQRLWPFK